MAAKQRDPERERFWRTTIADWQASGLSVRAYCLQHRLTETAFHYWRRELRDRAVNSLLDGRGTFGVSIPRGFTDGGEARVTVR